MALGSESKLPEGFTLDQPEQVAIALPEGFVLDDQPQETELVQGLQSQEQALADQMAASAQEYNDRRRLAGQRPPQGSPRSQRPISEIIAGLPQDVQERLLASHPPVKNRRGGNMGINRGSLERAAELELIRVQNPALAELIENTGNLEGSAIAYQSGLRDIADSTIGNEYLSKIGVLPYLAGKLYGDDRRSESTKEAINSLTQQNTGAAIGEVAGQAAPFVPLAGAAANIPAVAPRLAAISGIGATESGSITAAKGGTPGEVALSGVIGGIIGPLGDLAIPVLNRVGRRALNTPDAVGADDVRAVVDESGKITPEFEQFVQKNDIDIEGELQRQVDTITANPGDPAANKARRQVFEDAGIDPTSAQVSRDTSLFRDQQETAKTSGRVRDALDRQEFILNESISDVTAATKGVPEDASTSAIQAVTDKSLLLDDQINALYREARDAAPEAKNVKFNETSRTLRQSAPVDKMSNGTVKALRDQMRAMGVISKDFKPVGRISVAQAEELRKFANRISQSANGEGRHVIRQFKESLDNDVFRASGDDLFRRARSAKRDFEKNLDPDKLHKFDKRKKSLVRDILENDNGVQPEKILDKVLSKSSTYSAGDVAELRDFLLSGTPGQIAQGQRAWNDLRAAALQKIKDESFGGVENQLGVKALSRAKLESSIKRIGKDRMAVLFTPQERKFINRLEQISRLKEPPSGTFTGDGPSAQAISRAGLRVDSALSRTNSALSDLFRVATDVLKTRGAERRLLDLTDEFEGIQKVNARRSRAMLNLPGSGQAAAVGSVAAIPFVSENNNGN